MDKIIIEDIRGMDIKEKAPPSNILDSKGINEISSTYGGWDETKNETKNDRKEMIEEMAIIILIGTIVLLLVQIVTSIMKYVV